MSNEIESTGEKLSIEQREREAVEAIRRQLAKHRQQLLILGRRLAADHCLDAFIALLDGREDTQ